MSSELENFFLTLKNPNFLAMKLLLNVFNRMKLDDVSKKIIDNIDVLSSYNISLVDSGSSYNYVFSEDDLSSIEFAISKIGTEYFACHEFGHLLLDLFAMGEVPENYMEVNQLCIQRLMAREEEVSRMIKGFTYEVFNNFTEGINKPIEFLERHPEFVNDYFKENPSASRSDLLGEAVGGYFKLFSTFDKRADDYNRIGNIIDGMFHGSNPFSTYYGNHELYPVISMHDEEYFTEDDNGEIVAGFEEQFADYLVLRIYGDEMTGTVNTIRNLVGDEWFAMMDKFYEGIVDRIVSKEKNFQHKS